ncbi:hypothetical protein GJU43_22510 [Flavobacterium sp. LC2016-23]|uniref:DUF6090 family protein n=1 Tax=Flavobacterium sp. LC2016-23 TaxID=2666330 RepID=UPI0012B0CBDE|nr:DUF6090 family protein [Flavobacterium sp. LC2016-23]MRX42058.1 hypothetical protein [Flavobacterium sp. LC2016-23]
MEEELRKHLHNVTAVEKYQNKSLLGKVKHFVSEIVIIVFAVTLSISLHSWSEERHQQQETAEFLGDLKEDLKEEKVNQQHYSKEVKKATEMFRNFLEIDEKYIDSLEKNKQDISIHLNLLIHKFNRGNYEGFKSSGKIGFIKNRKLKKQILLFYEGRIPLTTEVENSYNDKIKILSDYATNARTKKEMFLPQRSKVMFDIARQAALNCDTVYTQNIVLIDSILKELKDKS